MQKDSVAFQSPFSPVALTCGGERRRKLARTPPSKRHGSSTAKTAKRYTVHPAHDLFPKAIEQPEHARL
jgi:hypothetical protein